MSGPTRRGRGRPKRQYRIRVRGERREHPDYDKLARALLEHAAIEDRARREKQPAPTSDNHNDNDNDNDNDNMPAFEHGRGES